MSGPASPASVTASACAECQRRGWLLAQLSGPLDCCARDRGRLAELLALQDSDLLRALAGRRRAELEEAYADFRADRLPREEGLEAICRHRADYPRALHAAAAPCMLEVAGGAARLARLTATPVVAILGSVKASDYGLEMAGSLARGLAAAGITVCGPLRDGVAAAAHTGALESGGAPLAVAAGGLHSARTARRRRRLYERLASAGCVVSELTCEQPQRRWAARASERIVVELAALVLVVEAEQTPGDLAAAHLAQVRRRRLAALPGRVTSPLSRGAHELLRDGAELVRDAQDVLELLCAAGADPVADASAPERPHLQPRLQAVLELVGAGLDTPDRLTRAGGDGGEVLLALSELELMGLLARGDGGRYVPRNPFA